MFKILVLDLCRSAAIQVVLIVVFFSKSHASFQTYSGSILRADVQQQSSLYFGSNLIIQYRKGLSSPLYSQSINNDWKIITLRDREPNEKPFPKSHNLCRIDNIQMNLCSPAPESFHVIDTTLRKLNNGETDLHNALMDLDALSRFIVKPDYAIQVYREGTRWTWDTLPDVSDKKRVLFVDGKQAGDYWYSDKSSSEIHHSHTSLELARLSVEKATGKREQDYEKRMQDIIKALEIGAHIRIRLAWKSIRRRSFSIGISGRQELGPYF